MLRYLIEKVHVSSPDLYVGPWSSLVEQQLKKKVITEGSSQIRTELNA